MKRICTVTGWLTPALLAALLMLPAVGAAQVYRPGASRVEMSDVTGANVASLMLFETGTTRTFDCPVAWGVRSTADDIITALGGGGLDVTSATGISREPSAEAQRRVLELLLNGENAGTARAQIDEALAGAGVQRKYIHALTHDLVGLLDKAHRMDPLKPGYVTASGLAAAVNSFNEFAERSDAAYLSSPPDEFLVTETVLSRLVIAALENEGRVVDQASLRGDYGLACAPPRTIVAAAAPAPEAPAPVELPPERAIEVCVMEEGRIHYVPAILLPLSGDTLALRDGVREPFQSAYPIAGYAAGLAWVESGETVTLGRETYIPYGVSAALPPGEELVQVGEFRGIQLFARRGSSSPAKQLFIPLTPRCTVQPYELMEDMRKKN